MSPRAPFLSLALLVGCTGSPDVNPPAATPTQAAAPAPAPAPAPAAKPAPAGATVDPGAAPWPDGAAGPATEPAYGPAVDGLALGLALADVAFTGDAPLRARISLKNTSKAPITVFSHVTADITHLDPFTLRLEHPVPATPGGDCTAVWSDQPVRERVLHLVDDRDESAPMDRTLQPGEVLTHVVDLQGWATRAVNGAAAIGPGFYRLAVEYTVPPGDRGGRTWSGTLKSEPRVFTIAGTPAPAMCRAIRTP